MRPSTTVCALFLAASLVSCGSKTDHADSMSSGPVDFGGRWSFERHLGSSTCTSQVIRELGSGYLDIDQVGDTLTVKDINVCGDYVYGGTGTATGATAVIVSDYNGDANPFCHVDEHFTETIALSGNMFSGEMRFTVNNEITCGNTSTPCEYMGTITATWCPPGSCHAYPMFCF